MIKTLRILYIVVLVELLIGSCAQQTAPSGGPKDTIPPTLILSIPEHQSLRIHESTVYLEFDEPINSSKLKEQLIITPFIESKYTLKYKKKSITLSFDEPFDSSTTYTFNFLEGITDITEKNPALDLTIAFSTGPFIDSLFITGNVVELLTQTPSKRTLVALYPPSDTTDMFYSKPTYLTYTDEEGQFAINNIKSGPYILQVFEDDNKNLTCEPDQEKHGFLSDTINLITQGIDSLTIPIQQIDSRPLHLVRSKPFSKYFDITYNKPISVLSIHTLIEKDSLWHNLIEDNTKIRIYPNTILLNTYKIDHDSIASVISVTDSLGNSRTDTAYIRFQTSKRKPIPFEYKLSSQTIDSKHIHFTLSTTKPILNFQLDSIQLRLDTLFTSGTSSLIRSTNTTREFEFAYDIDSLNQLLDSLLLVTEIDSLSSKEDSINNQLHQFYSTLNVQKPLLLLNKGTVLSVDNDTLNRIQFEPNTAANEYTAQLSGKITTRLTHFILQLLDDKHNVIRQTSNVSKYSFSHLPSGTYKFRILIDVNQNGLFDYGNILTNKEPEPVIILNKTTELRDNWELNDVDISF